MKTIGSAVHYHTYNPTDTTTGTQVSIGRECLGLIWHEPNGGFKWSHSVKVYSNLQSAKIAIVRAAMRHRKKEFDELLIELGRLNSDIQ